MQNWVGEAREVVLFSRVSYRINTKLVREALDGFLCFCKKDFMPNRYKIWLGPQSEFLTKSIQNWAVEALEDFLCLLIMKFN